MRVKSRYWTSCTAWQAIVYSYDKKTRKLFLYEATKPELVASYDDEGWEAA